MTKIATVTPTMSEREYLQRLSDKGYTVIPPNLMTVEDVLSLYAQIDALKAEVKNLDEGAKMLYTLATKGEEKLLQDWQLNAIAEEADAKDWQDQVTDLRAGG